MPEAAGGNILLKLVDPSGRLVVRGEVTEPGFEGSIELLTFRLRTFEPPDPFGRGAAPDNTNRNQAFCTKAVNATSFALFQFAAIGSPTRTNAQVTLRGNSPFSNVGLEDVSISSLGTGGVENGVAIEQFTLLFSRVSGVQSRAQNEDRQSRLRGVAGFAQQAAFLNGLR